MTVDASQALDVPAAVQVLNLHDEFLANWQLARIAFRFYTRGASI